MAEGQAQATVNLERIYLKDVSFESPQSPASLGSGFDSRVHLDLNTKSNVQEDERWEVVLTLTATVKASEGATVAIIEVQQAGLFHLAGLTDEQRRRVLGTFCPNVLFPYVREVVDSLAVRGGFPALHLAPINFDALYEQAGRRQQQTPSPGGDVQN